MSTMPYRGSGTVPPLDIEAIKAKIRTNEYVYSQHAELATRDDDLTFAQVEDALINAAILERAIQTQAAARAAWW